MAIHSSSLAWEISWTEKPGGLQSTGSQRVGHDWATSLSLSDCCCSALSCVQLLVTPWTSAHQAFLSFITSLSLLKLKSIESVMQSNNLILCHPLLFLPSIFPRIRVFSDESVLPIRWPKYWSFSFSISPSNEYSRLIFFRIDWFDLLAVQETLQSLFRVFSSATVKKH